MADPAKLTTIALTWRQKHDLCGVKLLLYLYAARPLNPAPRVTAADFTRFVR